MRVSQYTEGPGDVRQRWVGLRVWFWWPEVGWGAWWAALCGSLAAGVFHRLGGDSVLRLALVLVVADPLWANLTHLLCDLSWSVDACAELGERPPVRPRFLPYMQPASPGHRIIQWLGQAAAWYRLAFCPQAGWMLSGLIFCALGIVGIGWFLGPPALELFGWGIALIVLSLLLPACCPDLSIGARAAAEAGVACLVGYAAFAPQSASAWGLAVAFAVLYGGALRIAARGVDRTAWLLAVTLLALPAGCAVLGRNLIAAVLLAGCVFPIWLSGRAASQPTSPRWYLERIGPYVLGLTFLASIALGLN